MAVDFQIEPNSGSTPICRKNYIGVGSYRTPYDPAIYLSCENNIYNFKFKHLDNLF
jgi:hypothetical protein